MKNREKCGGYSFLCSITGRREYLKIKEEGHESGITALFN